MGVTIQGTPGFTVPDGTFSLSNYNINLPSGIVSGEKLLIIVAIKGQVSNTPISFNTLTATLKYIWRNGNQVANCFFLVEATGSEGSTTGITVETPGSTAEPSAVAWRITGWTGNLEADFASGSSISTINLPSVTPSWGAKDTKWMAYSSNNAGGRTVTTYPPDYTDTQNMPAPGIGAAQSLAWGWRDLNATSEDPGSYLWSAAGNVHGITVALEPITANNIRIVPDAILAQTNLTGALGTITDDPDSPDASWLVAP